MGVDECSKPLSALAAMAFPERVSFLEKNLTSLRPALDEFGDKAWEISGSRGHGTSRESFVAQHRDMFCSNSLARLLAARMHPKANKNGMPEDETPVDTFQVVRARAVIDGRHLDLHSEFRFYDRWLGAKRDKGGLSRLAELAFLRACEEGCHPERTHSRTLAFEWFYKHFGSEVERALILEYQGCLDTQQIDGAVAHGMSEFYHTYVPANNSPLLHIKRGYAVRSRWAGRAFLTIFLRDVCRRRLPPLFYVLRDSGHRTLRAQQFTTTAIDALWKIVDFTFNSAEEIVKTAKSADPGLSATHEQDLMNVLDRTSVSNPPPVSAKADETEVNLLDKLENCVVENEVPDRGMFAASISKSPEHEPVLTIGQKLTTCIMLRCRGAASPQCAISPVGCKFFVSCGDRQLTKTEQVRLNDYWYDEPRSETRNEQSASAQSRRSGFVRLRSCFALLLGIPLKLKAAARLREHVNHQNLPPGGLMALLFNEDDCEFLCQTDDNSLDKIARRYHVCGLPYGKLLDKKSEGEYRRKLVEWQRSHPDARIDAVLHEDLLQHWQRISRSIGEALDGLRPLLSGQEEE